MGEFDPHVVVIGLKIAFYEKTQSGKISPSAKKIEEGLIEFSGGSIAECQEQVNNFINKNRVVIFDGIVKE